MSFPYTDLVARCASCLPRRQVINARGREDEKKKQGEIGVKQSCAHKKERESGPCENAFESKYFYF